jgi:sporulation protein YlmC with PRC-barrel domain
MLITHVRPTELWGKKVYDTNGRYLGEVIAITSRRGVVRNVVVGRPSHSPVRLAPPVYARDDAERLVVPVPAAVGSPRLRVVR